MNFNSIINRLIEYWNKPFPSLDSKKESLIISFTLGLFVFMFLFIFNPFEIAKDTPHPYLYIAGFGIITFIVVLLIFTIVSLIPEKILNRKKWKLKNTFFLALINLIAISIANYYFIAVIGINEKPSGITNVIFYTVSVGIFPVFLILVYSEHKFSKENKKTALKAAGLLESRERSTEQKQGPTETLNIISAVKSDSFSVKADELLFVKAEGNYSVFFIENEKDYFKKIARIPLKDVEKLLNGMPYFIKCHRSYIVNIKKVTGASGNARNVTLCIDNRQLKVPVARSKEKTLISAIGHN